MKSVMGVKLPKNVTEIRTEQHYYENIKIYEDDQGYRHVVKVNSPRNNELSKEQIEAEKQMIKLIPQIRYYRLIKGWRTTRIAKHMNLNYVYLTCFIKRHVI